MVAVISGSGLGLFGSSVSALGGVGASGNAGVGRGTDRAYVNTTTGNLIVQSQDERLSALGLDLSLVRTYNSQGLLDDDNGDNWRLGVHQRVHGLTGAYNTADSTIRKVFGDGRDVTYRYDVVRQLYVSTDGEGAHDTLSYDSGTSQWTWTDGSGRNTETYNSAGQLTQSRDADGNTVSYGYTGGLLTQITDASGQTTELVYSGNNLTQIRVVSNGQTQTLTRYYYDSANRLRQVVLDLSPADNTVSLLDANGDGLFESVNGQMYVTTYTYDGTSTRIASITQGDGSSVSFTYQLIDGRYRVRTYTDAENRTTTLTYSEPTGGSGATNVSANPAALSTTRTENHSLNTGALTSPAGAGTWAAAQLLETSNGANATWPSVAFDASGNGFATWVLNGDIYVRRYDAATAQWSTAVRLDSNTTLSAAPQFAVDRVTGTAVLAWAQSSGIAVSTYDVSTNTWSAAQLVVSTGAVTLSEDYFGVSMAGNFAAITWLQNDGTRQNLRAIVANNGVWGTSTSLETSTQTASLPQVGIDSSGNALVTWRQSDGTAERVYYSRWSHATQSFSGATLLDGGPGATERPRLSFDGQGNAFAVWGQSSGLQVRRFDATSGTWGSVLSLQAGTVSSWDLAVDAQGNALVGWVQVDGATRSAYARRFDASSGTWSTVTVLESSAADVSPDKIAVAIARGNAAVSWLQTNGTNNDLYAAYLSSGTWSTPQLLDGRADPALWPYAAIDPAGNALVTWAQVDSTGARSIYQVRYTAAGSYTIPAGATWQSIANTLYGVNSTAAASALQSAMGNPALNAGTLLSGWPATLSVTSTVPGYYTVQSGDTWASITQAIYGTSATDAVSTLQATLGNPTLVAGLELTMPAVLSYGGTASSGYLQTNVQDALGLITTYTQDSSGRLTAVLSPTVGGTRMETRYAYDTDGNITSITQDPSGLNRVTTFGYDAKGNLILTRDSLGSTVTRTYDGNNQLLTETEYVVRDPDGAGSGQPSDPETTRYVYDAESHLRFVISADGRVTERQYDAAGRLTSTRTYTAARYTGTGVAESDLATWTGTLDRSYLELEFYAYDFRGNVSTITRYWGTTSAGAPLGTPMITRLVYDQRGQLLQTIDPRGESTTSNPNDYRTIYTYDGLGRVLTSNEWISATTTRTTLNVYDDAGRITRTTLANGLVTTRTYNRAGELISVANGTAGTPAALGRTTYAYDAGGRLRLQTEPTGVRQFFFYDEAGRQVAHVDGDGSLVEFVYNRAGQRIKTIEYAALLPAATRATLVDGSGNPATVALSTLRTAAGGNAANDRITSNVYDASGALVYTIDPSGAVVENRYDGAGRLTETIQYANRISIARTVDEVLPASVTVTTHADDRRTRYFHDGDGLRIGQLDAEGYLTEYSYNGAGRLSDETRYANQTAVGVRATGTFADLKSSVGTDTETATDPERDQVTHYLYDALGRQTGMLDAEGYLTETQYDGANNVSRRTRYDQVLTYRPKVSLMLSAVASTTVRETTIYTYDGGNKLIGEVSSRGTASASSSVTTTYSYDVVGNLVSSTRAAGTPEARTTTARYDFLGRVTQELTAEGSAQLAALTNPTAAQIEDIWSRYGITYAYDVAGRKISATVRPNGTQTNTTLYFYDEDNRVRFEINALGERTEYRYNALSQLTDRIRYTNRIATTGLVGGLLTDELQRTLSASANPAEDALTSFTYKLTGQVHTERTARTSNVADDTVTTYDYSAFGEVRTSTDSYGVVQEYRYDPRGLLTTTISDAATGGLNITSGRTYDAFGRLRTVTDARGIVVDRYEYDRLGRVVATTDASLSDRTVTMYDAFDRVLTMRDALNNTTIYAYDDANRRMTVTTPEGIAVVTTFTEHGQTLSVTAAGNTTRFEYDKDGQITSISDDLGTIETRTYDRAGRQETQTNAVGTLTRFTYDAANRVLTRTVDDAPTGLQLVTTYEYDGQGRVRDVTEPGGRLTRTTYGRDSRTVMVTVDPNGLNLRTAYTHDRLNRVLTVTEGYGSSNPQVVEYRYDVLGRRTHEIKDPGAGTNPSTDLPYLNLTTAYKYDAAGNLTRKIDPQGNSTWYVYDADNRLTHTVNALGEVVAQTYDAEDRVIATRAYAARIGTAGFGDVVTPVSVTANNGADRTSQTIYDRDGRARFSIDAAYAVTERTFDANGNVTHTRAYQFAVAPGSYTTAAAVIAALEAAGNSMSSVGADDRLSWAVYDLRGRTEFTVDAQGAVVRYAYDAAGNVTAQTAFATVRATSDAMGGANLRAWAQTTAVANHADNRTTRFWYDSAGREVFRLDAEGYLTETRHDDDARRSSTILYAAKPTIAAGADTAAVRNNSVVVGFDVAVDKTTTSVRDAAGRVVRIYDALTEGAQTLYEEHRYDAAGHRVATVDARGREIADTNSAWAQRERTTRGYPAELSSLTAAQRAELRDFYTTSHVFDGAGREIKVTDPLGNETSKTYDGVGNLIRLEDARGKVGYYFHDAAGRVRYQVDPLGYVTEKRYDALGNVTDEFSYADPLQFSMSPTTTMAQVAGGVRTDTTHDRHVSKTYDTAGRVHVTTYHGTTTYTDTTLYNTFGEKRQFTDKNHATYNYYYTRRGELEREILPAVDVVTALEPTVQVASLRLEHHYEYNAFGQLSVKREAANTDQQRVTRYFYDQRGAEERIELPAFVVFDRATGTTSTRTPAVQKSYDAAGNLVLEIAANDGRTVHYYDSRNLLVASVDADNVLREFEYDAVGNRTAERTYDTRLTGVQEPGTRPTAGNPTEYRELQHRYDARNLRVATYTRAELLFSEELIPYTPNRDGYYTAEVATFAEYDANGNLVRTIDGNNVANALASIRPKSTFQYYDASGNRILQVDPAGYVVRWEYNAQGQIERETKYAGQLNPTDRDDLTAQSDVNAIIAAILLVSPADDNRITEYDYDNHGRVWRERKVSVSYASVNSTTGALTETPGDIDTVYEYDGNGNITAQINPGAHGRIDREYDALGREQTVRDPQFLAFNGRGQPLFMTRSVLTHQYDAHGNVVVETRTAQGTSEYREQKFAFDVAGNMRSSTDATGATTRFDYDIAGNTLRAARTVVDVDGFRHEYRTLFSYDILGREESRQDIDDQGTLFEVTHESRDTRYNAHGDIEAKGINKQWQEQYRYDHLGRLIFTNKENGTPRLYAYDANGNAVVEIHAIDTDLSNVTHPSQVSPLDAQFTVNRYDLRNQLTEVIQPPMVYGTLLANQPLERIDPPEPLNDVLGSLSGYLPPVLNGNVPNPGTPPKYDTPYGNPWTSPTVVHYGVAPGTSPPTDPAWHNVNAGTFGLVPSFTPGPESTRVVSDETVETATGYERTLKREMTRTDVEVTIQQVSATVVKRKTRTVTYTFTQTSIYTRVRTPVGSETSEGENWTLTTQHDTDTTARVTERFEEFSRYTNSVTSYSYTGSSTTSAAATVNLVRSGNAGASWYSYQGSSPYPGYPPVYASVVSYSAPDLSGFGDGPTIVEVTANGYTHTTSGYGAVSGSFQTGGQLSSASMRVTRNGIVLLQTTFTGTGGSAAVTGAAVLKGQDAAATTARFRLLDGNGNPITNWDDTPDFIVARDSGKEFVFREPSPGAYPAGYLYEYEAYAGGQLLQRVRGTLGSSDHRREYVATTTYRMYDRYGANSAEGTGNHNGTPVNANPQHSSYLRTILSSISQGPNEEHIIRRRQEYNAFGEVTATIDGNNNRTDLYYNDLGKLVQEVQPEVSVHPEQGAAFNARPTWNYYYDELGQLVGTQDANSSLLPDGQRFYNTRVLVNGRLTKEFDAEGALTSYAYDGFGDMRQRTDALGRVRTYDYDENGRLELAIVYNDLQVEYSRDAYEYDAAGNRIAHTNALNRRETYLYDSQNRIRRHTSFGGDNPRNITRYSYVYSSAIGSIGGFEKTTRTEGETGEDTLVDRIDYFGKTRWHRDMGGHEYTYLYNYAGWLRQQTGTTADSSQNRLAQNIVYEYYHNGYLKSVTDSGINSVAQFQYDRNGNRTFESYSQTPIGAGTSEVHPYQAATAQYDALNRVTSVIEAGKFDIRYTYDAVGNRRSMHSTYFDLLAESQQDQLFFYTYDRMNRFTVTMGQRDTSDRDADGNTQEIVRGNTGYEIDYDLLGRREHVRSELLNAQRVPVYVHERYTYDPIDTVRESFVYNAAEVLVASTWRNNDQVGNLRDYYEYSYDAYQNPQLTKYEHKEYDDDGRIRFDENNTDPNRRDITEYHYVGNGILDSITIETVDSAGNPVTNIAAVTLDYTYEKWDTYKETFVDIQGDRPGWRSGQSQYKYNSNGHIVRLVDSQANNRTIDYVNNHFGQVLKRYEINPTQNGGTPDVRRFYYLNGRPIGDVGTEEARSRVDYAQQLAAQQKNGRDVHPAIGDRVLPVTSADFDQNYRPINEDYPPGTPSSHVVQSGETLQSIARSVWGDASLWYLIAEANGLSSDEELVAGLRLTIPNVVTNIHNNADTFRPYDPALALGDTTPTLPAPPPPPFQPKKRGCGALGMVLVIVVAIVVTVYTAGAAATAFSGGAAVGGGTAVVAGTATGIGTGAMMAAAAVGGAVGAAASQGVAIAMGMQKGFDWKGVALGALSAGVGAGLGAAASSAGALGTALRNMNPYVLASLNGATSSALTQGIAVTTGLQSSFNWRNVAISAVAASVAKTFGDVTTSLGGNGFASNFASGIGGSLVRRAFGSRESSASIIADAFGNAVGESIKGQMSPRPLGITADEWADAERQLQTDVAASQRALGIQLGVETGAAAGDLPMFGSVTIEGQRIRQGDDAALDQWYFLHQFYRSELTEEGRALVDQARDAAEANYGLMERHGRHNLAALNTVATNYDRITGSSAGTGAANLALGYNGGPASLTEKIIGTPLGLVGGGIEGLFRGTAGAMGFTRDVAGAALYKVGGGDLFAPSYERHGESVAGIVGLVSNPGAAVDAVGGYFSQVGNLYGVDPLRASSMVGRPIGELVAPGIELATVARGVQATGAAVRRAPATSSSAVLDDITQAPAGEDIMYTFRGDSRAPEVIFRDGFEARGSSTDLYLHALNNAKPPSAYVSTSMSFDIATEFATDLFSHPGNVYVVRPRNGIDVNQTLGSRSPIPREMEIAVPMRILPSDVRAVTPVTADGSFVGISILNPGYK